jgi:ethanolamine utilization protein EutQ (cupin superfamily)
MRNFLTLKQAAKKCKPVIDVEDILEMALDGKLKLSVDFINSVYAKTGEVHQLPEQDKVIFYPDYSSLKKLIGIYDLAMLGNEKFDVRNKLRQQNGEQKIDFDKSSLSSNGVLVVDEKGHYYQLQRLVGNDESEWLGYGIIENTNGTIHLPSIDNPENYEPRQYLPCESLEFVVREAEIHQFESTSSQIHYEKLEALSTEDEQPLNLTKGRREQCRYILELIEQLKYDPTNIPDGGKKLSNRFVKLIKIYSNVKLLLKQRGN